MPQKKFTSAVTILVAMVILLGGSAAYAERQDLHNSPWPHAQSDLQPDPAMQFSRLENGFRYVLLPNAEPKGRVSMHLDLQAGSLNEKDNERGLAHFLEHLMFNGTVHFPPGELVKFFQRIGMQFGPDANAHTGFDETVYDILLPNANRQIIEEGLQVMRDFAQGALLLPEEIENERRVVLAEMRDRDSSDYRTYVETMRFRYAGTLLPDRLPIGERKILLQADRERIKQFYDAWYRPDNIILVMVGDFDLPVAQQMITETFAGFLPRAALPATDPIGHLDHRSIKPFYHREQGAGSTTVSIETLTQTLPRPDSLGLEKELLLGFLADQIIQNRLDALLKKPDTEFTSANIGSSVGFNRFHSTWISAETTAGAWRQTLARLERILRQALQYGFSAAELDRVKKDFLAYLDNGVKESASRDSKEIARKIIWHLNADRVMQSPLQEQSIYGPYTKAVTLEQVHDAFRGNWSADHRLVLVTGNVAPTQMAEDPKKTILEVFRDSQRVPVQKPIQMATVHFPYLALPAKHGAVKWQRTLDDLGIVQVQFENGFCLNVRKSDYKANQVLANLSFGDGRSGEPRDASGLARLTEAVINESGFGQLDSEEIQRALAGKEAQLSLDVREDAFVLSGEAASQEVELLFQLLYTQLMDPALRASAYRLAMERLTQQYKSMARSIDGAAALESPRFLAGGDGRFGWPDLETLAQYSLDQVRQWILPYLSNAPLELSVVGDINPDQVIELARRYFGTLASKKRATGSEMRQAPRFPEGQTLKLQVDTRIEKALVIVAYPTTDMWDIHRTRRLSALADLFSERLRVQIREALGATYSPFAYHYAGRAFPGYGFLQAMIHVSPSDIQRVVAAVRAIADQLSQGVIEEDELKRILDPDVHSITDMRRTNEYWLDNVLTGSFRHPEQLDWSRTLQEDYSAITAAELGELARRYLDNARAATVTVVPRRTPSNSGSP